MVSYKQLSFILILLQCINSCDTSIYTRDCKFQVQNISSDCSTFIFVGCMQDTTHISSDWTTCLTQCFCRVSSSSSQTYQTLKNCQESKQNLVPMTIISTLLMGFLIITVIIFFCCMFYTKTKVLSVRELQMSNQIPIQNQWLQQIRPAIYAAKAALQNSRITRLKLATTLASYNSQWMNAKFKYDMTIKHRCQLCQMQRPLFEFIKCGHRYHYGCITEWVRTNSFCPFCSQKEINIVQIICEACHQNAKYFKLSDLEPFPPICTTCKQ